MRGIDDGAAYPLQGCFTLGESARHDWQSAAGDRTAGYINIDASRSWGASHTAAEFRPVNVAVLFCIKHD
jgi:hypothetical protein